MPLEGNLTSYAQTKASPRNSGALCYNKTNGGAFGINAMAISLEQYVAEATNAYKPAKDAVQAQLDAIPGQLQAANDTIARNYAQQQSQLNDQRNAAATSASLQAAGSGGSFGGKANLANRRYYTQSFVPAQTQLQTNQSNEMQRTRQSYDDKRTSLNSQLSSIDAQVNEMALQKYWAAVEAEKQRQWEAEQAEKARQAQIRAAQASAAASNPYQYIMDAMGKSNGGYTLMADRNMYGGFDWVDAQGNPHTLSTVAAAAAGGATSGDAFNRALYQLAQQAANQGDYYSQELVKQMNNGFRYAKGATAGTKSNALKTLDLNVTKW